MGGKIPTAVAILQQVMTLTFQQFILSSFTLHVSSVSRVSWLKGSRILLPLAACGLNFLAPVPRQYRHLPTPKLPVATTTNDPPNSQTPPVPRQGLFHRGEGRLHR